MNAKRTADAVVRALEGDVRIAPAVRTYEGGQRFLEDLEAELMDVEADVRRTLATELRVRDDVGGWAR